MRNPVLTIVLVLLALIPIGAWGYTAYGTALTYNVGKPYAAGVLIQILAGLTPGLIGAVLMAIGAFLLSRKPLGARITATVGLVLIILTVVVFVALEGARIGPEMLAVAAAYALPHAGMIVWVWSDRRRTTV